MTHNVKPAPSTAGRRHAPTGRISFSCLIQRPAARCLTPALLAAAAGLSGCASEPPPPAAAPAPQKIVLDYRNGWFHKASGAETLEQVAKHYKRDPKLVADINQQSGPYAVPAAGTMLYIPPYNDRDQVRFLLMRLQGRPELIPKTPWDPTTGAPRRTEADPAAAPTLEPTPTPTPTPAPTATPAPTPEPTPAAMHAGVKPSNPLASPAPTVTPSPLSPGMTEKVIAESKPVRRQGLFSWMFGPKKQENTDKPPKPPVEPTPQPVRPPFNPPSPGGYVWPVKGRVVATFRSGWQQACHGLEIAAPEGTPVCAARAGTVLLAQAFPGYGNLILIDHGDGYATAYGYNRQMVVRTGQRVEAGQVIGSVGRASQGAESRLHFQVRRNALPVDPIPFLKK